jgi:molybdopterin molybdotransferase
MARAPLKTVSSEAAARLIGEHLVCLPTESLPLAQCAGAVLRENVYAERDQPPFDRVAMDGIAIASAAVAPARPAGGRPRRLRVQATQAAGEPPLTLADAGACIEVMTGAVLPPGCDCVVPVERITVADGFATLGNNAEVAPWVNVHRRASDGRQGDLLVEAGTLLNAPEIAVAASAGMGRLRVSAQPAIAVISTGNELVEPGEPVLPHQIRRSNAYAIAAALQGHGFKRVADDHVPDEIDTLRARLDFHLRTHEVLVLSGGVSMGKFDLVPQVLTELGVQCQLHGIAQRPGRPMWFGMSADGRAVFALPGNPVSTLVCLARYVLPALYAAMGESGDRSERIALDEAIEWSPALTGFMPVAVHHDSWGRPWASPRPTNGSGDFGALALTQGFVELPPGPTSLPKGFVTRLFRW